MANVSELNALLAAVDGDADLSATRLAILDQIERSLRRHESRLGRWEKDHLATALSALQWNINHRGQPSRWWLRYCLQNIWKADIPPDQRSEDPSKEDAVLDAISYSDILAAISDLRHQIGMNADAL
jgi:hypothetical protein